MRGEEQTVYILFVGFCILGMVIGYGWGLERQQDEVVRWKRRYRHLKRLVRTSNSEVE